MELFTREPRLKNAAVVEHLDLAAEVRRWSGARTAGQVVHELAEPAS